MVKATRKHNQIVQVGQQQRSGLIWNEIMQRIKSGELGQITKVNTWGNFTGSMGLAYPPNESIPKGVDYERWLGPSPSRAFNPLKFHGKWRYFWDYGGGLMTDWGVHLLDMALWAKDVDYAPIEVMASGGNFEGLDYHLETISNLSVVYSMKDYIITWQNAAGAETGPYDMSYGVEFVGVEGTIISDRNNYEIIKDGEVESVKPQKL